MIRAWIKNKFVAAKRFLNNAKRELVRDKWLMFFTGTNLVGLFLFLFFVAGINETIRMEERQGPDFGDGLHLFVTAVPVFLTCLLINFIWGIKALIAIYYRRNYRSSIVLTGAVANWIGLIVILRHASD